MHSAKGYPEPPRHAKVTVCQPLSLRPLHPIVQAQRVHRQVRPRGGQPRTRLVIQPITNGAAAAPPTVGYAIKSVLCQQAKKGVILFLATPVVPEDISSICLVSQGSPVVIKVVPQPTKATEDRHDDPLSEVAAMQLLRQRHPSPHPHVIQMLDCMQDDQFVYLVLPYLEGGDFFAKLDSLGDKGIPEADAQTYLRQICLGLLHMKQSQLSHHDVSLENICVDKKGNCQLIDLGMALPIPDEACLAASTWVNGKAPKVVVQGSVKHQKCGNGATYLITQPCRGKKAYMSPERVREAPMDPFASDVWSLGVCLHAILTGRLLYHSFDDRAFKVMERKGGVQHVISVYEQWGLHLSPTAKELICAMLNPDASQRPTLEEILQHSWLKQPVSALPSSDP